MASWPEYDEDADEFGPSVLELDGPTDEELHELFAEMSLDCA